MDDDHKTKAQLIEELQALRQGVAELKAGEAARESKEWHQAILQAAMDGFWMVDMQGRLLQVNESYCRMSGYSAQELLTMRISDLDAVETSGETASHILKIMAQGRDRFESRHRRKDGSIFDVKVSVQYHSIKGGRFVGFVRDVTERIRRTAEAEQAEALLRKSEGHFRSVAQTAHDAIISGDSRGNVVFWNRAATSMFGYSSDEMLGRSIQLIMPERFRPVHQAGMERVVSTGKTKIIGKTVELVGLRKDGGEFPIELSLASWETGEGTFFTSIVRDITERVRSEAERRQAQESLGRYAEQLAARNAELDAFAHTVAHDLKNPVGVVMGFAELLVKDHATMPPESLADALRQILRTGQRLDTIVEELMLLAGVRKRQVVPEALDMGCVVRNAIERLQTLVQDRQAPITLLDESAWPAALGYAPWIEEVWANYISNAIQYGGQPPHVQVGADPFPLSSPSLAGGKEGGMVRFWVRDNGSGVSAEAQAALFAPFTRLEQVRAKGHGLGLSIVRYIVEKLGGQVGVESTPGQGSTFFFTLPAGPKEPK